MPHPHQPFRERDARSGVPAKGTPASMEDASGLHVLYRQDTEAILGRERISARAYFAALGASAAAILLGAAAWAYQLWFGMGMSGLQHPLMWATYITNFVWWIGVAHAGTLISAILYLLRASFRPALSRFAEAFGFIAITSAMAYPIIHLGRPWRFYWLVPYPNDRGLWPNFRSPLVLDVFAISTDIAVAGIFLWLGLLPDLAIVRDRSKGWTRTITGLLSLGWESTGRQWKHHRAAYTLVAGLTTAFIVTSHSVVSWDFALSIVPGWHGTLMPPYFIVVALLSGFAMILTLVVPIRRLLKLEEYITWEHIDWVARLTVVMSLFVTFAHFLDYFLVWLAGDPIQQITVLNYLTGSFSLQFWGGALFNSIVPLALLWPAVRRKEWALFAISIGIHIGMWFVRFTIVAGALARDYLPYTWAEGGYEFTLTELGISIGSLGWFFFWLLLFIRYLPVLPIAELKRQRLRKFREEQALQSCEGS